MNSIVKYFFESKKQVKEVGWFRNALYLFIMYRAIIYTINFKALFSENKFIYDSSKHTTIINDFVYFLTNNYHVWLGAICIFLIAALAVVGLIKKSTIITNSILWYLIINFNNFLYPTLTGGDYLLNQLLLFNVFLNLKTLKNPFLNDVSVALHNAALLALKLQICFAYFLAGWYKLIDESWYSGMAIYQIVHVPEYSNKFLVALPLFACTIVTYLTIAYQLLFPFLVWIRPLKIYLFLFGIVQHLFIAFGMGLFSFGAIMIICYILFLKYDSSLKHPI